MSNNLEIQQPIESKINDDQYIIKIETEEQAEQIANLLNSKASNNPKLQQALNEYNEIMNGDSEAVNKIREFDLF